MRPLSVIAVVAVAALVSACGGAETPGSPDKPQVGKLTELSSSGRSNEAAGSGAGAEPGYQKLVERQSSKPRSRFTPCNLVTRAQAHTILGAPVLLPREAPQGPTCIYRSRTGDTFITLAVQAQDFDALKRQLRRPRSVDVSGRSAFCGTYGQPMLYVSLSGGRVLSVGAPCAVARPFAARAVARLSV